MGKWSLILSFNRSFFPPKKHLENPQALLQEQTSSVETQDNLPPATRNSSRSSPCERAQVPSPVNSPSWESSSLPCQHS